MSANILGYKIMAEKIKKPKLKDEPEPPKKPLPPLKPKETVLVREDSLYFSGSVSVQDLMDKVKDGFENSIIRVDNDYDYDGSCVSSTIIVDVYKLKPNTRLLKEEKLYQKELDKYNTILAVYEKLYKQYEIDLDHYVKVTIPEYKKEYSKWQESEKQLEIESLEKRLQKLKGKK